MKWANINVLLFYACAFGTINAATFNRNVEQTQHNTSSRIQGKTPELQSSFGLSDFANILNKFGKPSHHQHHEDHCEDVLQYPVNIPVDATIAKYGKLDLQGFQYTYDGEFSEEDGVVILTLTHDKQILVSEGGLCGTYYLYQIRFKVPSANTVAGIHYPMAVQFIFINTLYADYAVASSHEDGLAVLVVFVTVGANGNPAFDDLISYLEDSKPLEDQFSPGSLLPRELCSFFRYRGKFSQDACEEIATFTLFTDNIQISDEQYKNLLGLLEASRDTETKVKSKPNDVTELAITSTPSDAQNEPTTITNKRKRRPTNVSKPRIIDFSKIKLNRRPLITIQPIMFCKTPLLDKSGFPWFLFYKH